MSNSGREHEVGTQPAKARHRTAGPRQGQRSVRRSGPERREEVAAATLQLMARVGLQGTTVSRIAREVGVEPPSLYAHFSSRQEMLLAAMDVLSERIDRFLKVSTDPDILVRLREIGEAHASFMTAEFEGFVMPSYEFATAPRDTGLGETIGERTFQNLQTIADMVEEGKRQGTIRKDMDSRLAAWELLVCYWAEDVAQLMNMQGEYLAGGYSRRILHLFLRDMAPSAEASQPTQNS